MLFAAVYIPNFFLQAALRHQPDLYWQPAALVEGDAAKATIQQVSDAARLAGVSEGFESAQAMARCPALVFRTRSASGERAASGALLQTAAAFSPYIEDTAPGVCAIDLRGLGFEELVGVKEHAGERSRQQSFDFLDSIPAQPQDHARENPLNAWAKNLLLALHSVNLHARIGIAATPSVALLAARSPQPITIVSNPSDFVASLPIEALDPEPDTLDLLRRWGIRGVRQFIALGKDAIAERLGADALELFEKASVQLIRPLEIVAPPSTFEEEMEFEARIETLEPLLFVLRRFVEQLATRIALTYRVVSEIELRLMLESGDSYKHSFRIPAPTSHVDTLFRMLQTHLEQVRTDAPITGLRLSATPSRAENHQFGLFESALRDPNQFHETLARLVALLGNDRVGSPVLEQTHRPDAFQMRRPEFDSAATPSSRGAAQVGPALRRFRPPLDAEVDLADGKPVYVRTLVISGPVKRCRGPWIGSGDWWDKRRWARNEWDVELRDGTLCRLYCSEEKWFTEGVYD